MEKTQRYIKPLFNYETHLFNMNAWDQCLELYNKKQFVESANKLIEYINSKYNTVDLNVQNFAYCIHHGSINLYITRQGDQIKVRAPFLKIPSEKSVALYRQISEINFFDLIVPQIYLKDEVLTFEASFDVELANPYMFYDLLKSICTTGDHYDDLFVEKFKAQHLNNESDIYVPSNELVNNAYALFQEILNECFNSINYFESKRLNLFLMDSFWIFNFKMMSVFQPQGILASDLRVFEANLKSNLPFEKKIEVAKKQLEKFKNYRIENFSNSLNRREIFITNKSYIKPERFETIFEAYFKNAKAERERNDFCGSALSLLVGFYNILHYYKIDAHFESVITSSLQMSSDKSWKEASDILFQQSLILKNLVCVQNQTSQVMNGVMNYDLSQIFKGVVNG